MEPGGSGGGVKGELGQDPRRRTSMKPLSGIRVIDLTQPRGAGRVAGDERYRVDALEAEGVIVRCEQQ